MPLQTNLKLNDMRKIAVIIFVICASAIASTAQTSKKPGSISGSVHCVDGGHPVDFANIILPRSNQYTLTDKDGNFSIENVSAGEVQLSVSFFGMEPVDTVFTVSAGRNVHLKLMMTPTSFHIDNVTVIATQNKAGSSTSSNISRQAMDHMQTSSLKDVMSLLPGVSITNPDLSSAQSISIRSNSGLAMNSLGTAIIVDGAPMSNNANLQVLTTSQKGSTNADTGLSGNASASSGVDIRSLSTDNIESVEVIRGIPSVEYGDMTSGAVIVKSKAGKSPLTIRFKTNPNIYQVSAAKGMQLGKKGGDLNLSGDYAYNIKEITNNLNKYQRANIKALWSVMFAKNTTANTSLSVAYENQKRHTNPDDTNINESKVENINLTFNHNGKSFVNRYWLKSINWLVSGSYTNKDSYYRDTATNAMNLYSTAMETGIYTNIGGLEYKDADGNTITTLHTDPSVTGTVLPYAYGYRYNIYGKELNAYAKLNFDMGHNWGNVSEKMLVGADFKTDGNLGRGTVFDDSNPPFRNVDNVDSGYRRRPYYDIPFINQFGLYAENIFSYRFAQRELNLTAGVRYDLINGKSVLAPRLNGSVDAFPWMTVRAGWGITSKAPTAIYLYPNKAYHDLIIYNGMGVENHDERVLVAQTTVYDTENPDLKIATNRKAEIGVDFNIAKRFRVSVTAYDELLKNGYSFSQDFGSFHYYTAFPASGAGQKYIIAQQNPGSVPTLILNENRKSMNMFFETYKPMNSLISHNSGIEYEIDLGRFDAINTSFYINGAWMKGEYTKQSYSYSKLEPSSSAQKHIGIYDKQSSSYLNESLNTTLRITHNIPKIGLAITLTGQFNWYSKSWTETKMLDGTYMDELFIGYISHEDGKVYMFNDAKFDDPNVVTMGLTSKEIIAKNNEMRADKNYSYMFPSRSKDRFLVEKYIPYAIFNLNVTKEIRDIMTASFYVNNFTNSRVLHKNIAGSGYTELGIPIFFGFELKVTIK